MSKLFGQRYGFTLVELLVVVLILGILSALALPSYISSSFAAKQKVANVNARAVAIAIQSRGVRSGSYPSNALADSMVVADMGGALPNNPCSASTGAAAYTFTYTDGKNVSIQAKTDACVGFAAKTYSLKL